MKRCTKCSKVKPLSGFSKDRSTKDGLSFRCRMCQKTYNDTHKEEIKVRGKAYYITNKKKLAMQHKIWKKNHKKELENIALKDKYGITLEDKREMWKKQNGRCAICKKKLIESNDCHVDHCHITGMVRGLLCRKCNAVLGYANDDSIILQDAINYLLQWKGFNENRK